MINDIIEKVHGISLYKNNFKFLLSICKAFYAVGFTAWVQTPYEYLIHDYLLLMLNFLVKCEKKSDKEMKTFELFMTELMKNPRCEHEETLLHKAVCLVRVGGGHVEFYPDDDDRLPPFGNPSLVEALLRFGGNINATDNARNTPLHSFFVNVGNSDVEEVDPETSKQMAKLLIKHGANLGCKNMEGMTPMDIAERKGLSKLLDLSYVP